MIRTTVSVSGMMCSMCEAHINQAIRDALPVKKVSSSHSKGKTVILSDHPLDKDLLRRTISATGYMMVSAETETIERIPFLSKLFSH